MKSVVRNYVAKIALLAILRYVELKTPEFEIDAFIAGLGESDLKDFELFDKYPVKDIDKLLQGLKNQAEDDEAFFLRLGLEVLASQIGSYSFFLKNSPNFRDLLTKSSQFSHVITDVISKIAIEEKSDHVKVSYHLSRDALKLSMQSQAANIEMSFAAVTVLYNEMIFAKDQKLVFHSSCSHELTDDAVSKLLGHEFISNASQNFIIVPNAVLDIENPRYEAKLPTMVSQGLSKHLESQNEGSLVSIILNLLEVKPASSLEDISHQLHISKRTLQRRLKDQSINFTALKQTSANQKSIELLDSKDHTIEEVARLLGYSSTATFVHAFTKWHGVSPSAYLKQN